VWLSRLWPGWQEVLAFVQPRTVIAWQKKRFRNYWRRLSQSGRPGRPAIGKEVRIVHFNITEYPTAQWTAQQILEAFPWDTAPRYLLRDRDAIYGKHFQQRIKNICIEEVKIATRSPWQNPYCERVIGSIRCDVLDHVVVLHARHLMRLLTAYFSDYHRFRTHLSLAMDCPIPRAVEPLEYGPVRVVSEVGGLHHHYKRIAA